MTTPLTFFFAFLAVLALIGLVAWLVRRFAGNRLGTNANRGRMPRLAVIDAAAVDGRRRLVLVRRDNVEHLLMIGGPTDIVVEPNIVRANPVREQMPQRPTALEAGNWDGDGQAEHQEPQLPDLPPRPPRPAFAEEVRRPAPPIPERRNPDHMPGIMLDTISRPEPRPEPRMEPRPEPRMEPREPRPELPPRSQPRAEPAMPPMPRPPRPAEPPKAPPIRTERAAPPPAPPQPPAQSISAADQNLADMANRLEAALRRPAGEARPEPIEPRVGAPPVVPEPPPSRPAARAEARQEPSMAAPVSSSPKSGFENLEDEMASLLGRPKTPS
ncbi:MAG: flagellar biosynthetic protein FliO [Rhodopseudomonas sp.]|uniref:flagellar biosynthetic protein FliO n=1 Tax=Rhodopseudomonas sp. TaxID=1078 RepID=UPI0018214947|nr:flagellar biosynthetic protein FliO [Rhodopseudomonas sp.]NVN84683.1 flagellar biosynthetic protein FliO [Rhodopseudomonas sp.]